MKRRKKLNSFNIDFENKSGDSAFNDTSIIELLLPCVLEKENICFPIEIGYFFVNDNEIKAINVKTRGIDKETDVLSFPMYNNINEIKAAYKQFKAPPYLGDIIISSNKCLEQAEEYGHSIRRELAFLTLHGILHLLGYDHMNEDDEKKMFGLQNEILELLGLNR